MFCWPVSAERSSKRESEVGLPFDSKGCPLGPQFGPLPSLKGSAPWARVLKVVYSGVTMRPSGFRIRGPYQLGRRIYFGFVHRSL